MIDAHIHLGGPDKGDGKSLTQVQLISNMNVCGITKAVVFPFNQPHNAFSAANDHIAKAVREYPDRLIGFARLNPNDGAQALAELDRIYELGLKGIKLHPTAQDFTFDNTNLDKIAEKAAEYRLPLIFDAGKAQSRPEDLEKFALLHPDCAIIMAHMYGNFIHTLLACPNVIVQTTAMLKSKIIVEAVEKIGADRIMMGSDYPYLNMCAEVKKIQDLDITDWDKAYLFGKTAQLLIGV
ncbi:MAG: amidohydrolase family protein [Candidatus Methanoperedens sp.]|nr:amidohydrolase family protein [Candidatus Methanoperedens sp.]